MNEAFGDDGVVEPSTMRGRDWPCLRQFGVFLQNRVGGLYEALRTVERDDLQVMAMSVVDSADCAVLRLVVNHYERAHELFEFSELTVFETDIIGVVLPDADQPHARLCTALMSAELSIHYMYPMSYRRNGRTAVAIGVADVDEALRVLNEQSYELVTENDLINFDERFGG